MRVPVLSSHDDRANLTILKMGSVEHTLEDPMVRDIRHRFSRGERLTMGDVDYLNTVLNRWGSSAYLGATYPAVVFLLEVLVDGDPLKAIEITALLTTDSDTCAAIVGQLVTALHGSDWINCDAGVQVRTSPDAPIELLPDFTDDLTGTGSHSIRQFIDRVGGKITSGIS